MLRFTAIALLGGAVIFWLYRALPDPADLPDEPAAATATPAPPAPHVRADRDHELRRVIAGKLPAPDPGAPPPPPPPPPPKEPASTTPAPSVAGPKATLRGRAVGGDGRPLLHTRVEVLPLTAQSAETSTTHTRLNGDFDLEVPAAGWYRVRLRAMLDEPGDPPAAEQVIYAGPRARRERVLATGRAVTCRLFGADGRQAGLRMIMMLVQREGGGGFGMGIGGSGPLTQSVSFLWPQRAKSVRVDLGGYAAQGVVELHGPNDGCEIHARVRPQ